MDKPIPFGALVGLMVCGTGEPDSVRGEIRRVEDGAERRRVVARRGRLTRVETTGGEVLRIVGPSGQWYRQEDGLTYRPHDRSLHLDFGGAPIGGLDVGGERPSWSRWDGTDFTTPTGPVEVTEFLGRPAFAVELKPPGHKPAPMQLVVDAATGLVLRTSNEALGWVSEWVTLEVGADLPDELFTWDGPAGAAPTREELQARGDAEDERRRTWLDARGIADLPIAAEAELSLHEWDDDSGSFLLGVEVNAYGTLRRRPRSPEPWPEAEPDGRRWSDSKWDWCLSGDFTLSPQQLALLEVRLATTT